jgi:hypothetical protein
MDLRSTWHLQVFFTIVIGEAPAKSQQVVIVSFSFNSLDGKYPLTQRAFAGHYFSRQLYKFETALVTFHGNSFLDKVDATLQEKRGIFPPRIL